MFLIFINGFSQNSSLNISTEYGKHTVGFKTFYEYDSTRSFSKETSDNGINNGESTFRPLQVYVWYPAQSSNQNIMHYSDYFFLIANETKKKNITQDIKKEIIEKFVNEEGVDGDILNEELNANMKAFLD
ncbi:MAG TPA: hypothetical protein VKN14_01825, partial [Flavobacteriaceae bacterium]|nr:hypothetical protein [Flavobacteriaceae bacterium]